MVLPSSSGLLDPEGEVSGSLEASELLTSLHGVTSRKTRIFNITAVRTSCVCVFMCVHMYMYVGVYIYMYSVSFHVNSVLFHVNPQSVGCVCSTYVGACLTSRNIIFPDGNIGWSN